MILVNKPGLYRLSLRSYKPEAQRFQYGVTHEVLPQIDSAQRNLLDFVYGDIARQLRDLEIAMYNEDREEMQEIIREIHKAITEVQTNR